MKRFQVEPWRDSVAVLMTSRSAFWRDDLSRLAGATDPPVTEIIVPEFDDGELNKFLSEMGLERKDLRPALLNLMKIPRFARLALSL